MNSLWQETEPPILPSLGAHESADVCVIGGGVSGLLCALRLLEDGHRVVVLDRGEFYAGESVRTTAHLTYMLDDRLHHLRRRHGAATARLAVESHRAAIHELEAIASARDFERVPGYLFLAPRHDVSELERELAAWHETGIEEPEFVESARSPLFPSGPALRFPAQARLHAGRFLASLASRVTELGGRLYSHTEALSHDGGRVATNRGFEVRCDSVVLATHFPESGHALSLRLAPYRSYVLGVEIPANRGDASLYWDTASPYHYLRTAVGPGGETLLLAGGGDHRTGHAPEADPFAELERWVRDRLGVNGETRFRWSGQILEPHDRLALLGRSPWDHRTYVITGFSGNGFTYAAIAARLIADLVAGRANPYEALYDPARVNIRSLGSYLAENARAAAPYTDWLTTGDVSAIEEIPTGEGAILRDGPWKLAVYRDLQGCPYFYSAVCPHRAGIVRWNASEKTWDCPCHGSRFDRHGHLLNGPATTGLAVVGGEAEPTGEAVSA